MKRLLLAAIALMIVLSSALLVSLFSSEQEGMICFASICLQRPGSAVIENSQPQIDQSVVELSEQITAGIENDYDKLVAIYDWVTTNISYDLGKAANLSAYGSGAAYALANKSGVCHDYAELTKELLIASGLDAAYIRGEVAVGEGELELHAWNEVFINGQIYAVDTTWGAGFLLEGKSGFIRKPRRIYLTTPDELAKLHGDPDYKQYREEEYLRESTAGEPVIYRPELERSVFNFFNSYREEVRLKSLTREERLSDLAREHAEKSAEAVCRGEEIAFDQLTVELNKVAPTINARSAGMYILVRWLYDQANDEDKFKEIAAEQAGPLEDDRWQALSVGVVQKGNLIVFVSIFLEYN